MAAIWWLWCFLVFFQDSSFHPGVTSVEGNSVPMPSHPPLTQEAVGTRGTGGTPVCPPGCICDTPGGGRDGQHSGHKNAVSCHFPFLHQGIDLRFPDVNNIQVLTITCDTDLLISRTKRGLFSHLKNLDTLQIKGCRLISLHNHTFEGLSNLTTLIINHAGLEDIYESGWLKVLDNLKSIDLSMNEIRYIPMDLFCNRGLENVNLTANGLWNSTYLGLKPRQDGGVCGKEMVAVDLSYNYIQFFDLELLKSFPNLEGMILRFSGIYHLYPSVFKRMTSLLEIDLTGNHLKVIDNQTFGVLPKLRNLYLCHNSLEMIDIDFTVSFPSLEKLNIREKHFFHYISVNNVTTLSISGNKIEHITARAFQNFVELKALNIIENNLTTIEEETFYGLSNLRLLNLERNYIQRISTNAFKHCPSLTRLILKKNGLFAGLPQAIFYLPNVKFIDLTNNYITEIDPEQHQQLNATQVLRIDRRHNRWLPDWMVEKTFHQFITRYYAFTNQTSSSMTYHVPPHFTSYVKLNLYQNKDQSMYTDLHLLLLREITHIYFQFHGSPTQKSNVILIDLAFNTIKKIGTSEYDLLNLLPENKFGDTRAVKSPDIISSLSHKTDMKVDLLIPGGFQCHCLLRYLRTLLDTSQNDITILNPEENPMKKDLLKQQCVNDKIEMWTSALNHPPTEQQLCFTDSLCNPKTCPCCHDLSCSCIQQCPSQCSCILDNMNRFTIIDCINAGLTEVISTIPTSATHLKLDWNHFIEIPNAAFSHFNHLMDLYLNNSKVNVIRKDAFEGLVHLRKFYLQDNLLNDIHNWTFKNLPFLDTLDLSFNTLTNIEPNSFSHLLELRELNLNGNNLTDLDLDQFDDLPLQVITLGDNPWSCGCDFIRRFRKWLIKNHDAVADIKNIYCFNAEQGSEQNKTSPYSSWLSMLYVEGNSSDSSTLPLEKGWVSVLKGNFSHCGPGFDTMIVISSSNSMHLAMGLLSLGFILLCIAAIFIFRKRLPLLVLIHSRFPKLFQTLFNCFTKGPTEKQFDIFVVYSPSDWDFVFHQLVPGLEEKSQLKVCTDYFNWPAAKVITNTIITSVEKSRYTLLVLSRNFFNNEWCSYCFRVAHHRSLKEMDHQVLVLLMPAMTKTFTKNISPDLKLYLKTKVCIKWKDPGFWKRIQYITRTNNCKDTQSKDIPDSAGTHVIIDVPDHFM